MLVHLLAASAVAFLPLSSPTVIDVASAAAASSDSAVVLSVKGDVTNVLALTREQLIARPQHEAQVTIHERTATYRGVSLPELLELAGVPQGRELLRTVVFARGADGYEVVFALAELSSDFTDRIALIADAGDGEPLPAEEGPIRLVVPWEKRGARSVRQITEIEVHILP